MAQGSALRVMDLRVRSISAQQYWRRSGGQFSDAARNREGKYRSLQEIARNGNGRAEARGHRAAPGGATAQACGPQEADRPKRGLTAFCQSRQCVGCTLTGALVAALTQPRRTRRHGNTNALTSPASITANSRSRSKGALVMGCHSIDKWSCHSLRSALILINPNIINSSRRNLAKGACFRNSVQLLKGNSGGPARGALQ